MFRVSFTTKLVDPTRSANFTRHCRIANGLLTSLDEKSSTTSGNFDDSHVMVTTSTDTTITTSTVSSDVIVLGESPGNRDLQSAEAINDVSFERRIHSSSNTADAKEKACCTSDDVTNRRQRVTHEMQIRANRRERERVRRLAVAFNNLSDLLPQSSTRRYQQQYRHTSQLRLLRGAVDYITALRLMLNAAEDRCLHDGSRALERHDGVGRVRKRTIRYHCHVCSGL